MKPEVTILVGTRQRLAYLKRCLATLKFLPPGFAEIIVIDAASTDGTREYLSSKESIIPILEDRPSGQAAGLNRGARRGTAPYICWLSDDNRLRSGALEMAVAILKKDAQIGMVGLRVKDTCGRFTPYPFIGGVSIAGVITCNQGLIRRELFEQIGGFDEELRDYLIDSDITTKVLLAGKDVVHLRPVAIDHDRERGDESWMSVQGRELQNQRNTLIYLQRYPQLVSAAYDHAFTQQKQIMWNLWSAALKQEIRCRFTKSDHNIYEFYRSHILYAKSPFVSLSDVSPEGVDWSLRQTLKNYRPASLSPDISLETSIVIRRRIIYSIIGRFEVLSFLHERFLKFTVAIFYLGILQFVARLSTDRDRFSWFILWVTNFPPDLARYVLNLLKPPMAKPVPAIGVKPEPDTELVTP